MQGKQGPFPKLFTTDVQTKYSSQKATLVAAIKECSKREDLKTAVRIHEDAVTNYLHRNKYVASLLITMYTRCHCMQLAKRVFDEIPHPDVVIWNSLLLGYIANGESLEALKLSTKMQCLPSSVTYVALLKACGILARKNDTERLAYLEKGINIHKQIKARGLLSDVFVATTLIDMYCKCGSMEHAQKIFESMVDRNVVAWNSIILGYVEDGQNGKAMEHFHSLDCEPSYVTYVGALKCCGALASAEQHGKQKCLERGTAIHRDVKARGLDTNMVVATAVIDMYGKCGWATGAREVFDNMRHRDVVAWTALLQSYVENDQSLAALDLFDKMDCKPTLVTYIVVVKACGCLASQSLQKQPHLKKGLSLHKDIKTLGFDSDIVLSNALIDMFSKCACVDRAKEVFDNMICPDIISWNTLVLGYVDNGESLSALNLFKKINCEPNSLTYVAVLKACSGLAKEASHKEDALRHGIVVHEQIKHRELESETIVMTSLLDMYCKCGEMDTAKKVFDSISAPNTISWNSLMLGYVLNGESMKALKLFTDVCFEPDAVTYVIVLKAVSSLTELSTGKKIHSMICQKGFDRDHMISNSLVDFYMKSGCICRAEEVFDSMQAPDIVSWNIMMTGYSISKDPLHVFVLKDRMEAAGVQLDRVSYICILIACSRAGLLEESKRYFGSMVAQGVIPSAEHYNCLTDVMSRAGLPEETLALIDKLKIEPNPIMWRILTRAFIG